jgi:TrmH family RNA methyltransferase
MLSINQKKYVNSLKQKKFRTQHNSFVVEGVKLIDELLYSGYKIEAIYATTTWIEKNPTIDCIEISEKELNSISSLKTPNQIIAVVKQQENQLADVNSDLTIALDKIQDPGNLGTIIRTADWFGVKNIVCSEDTVDIYNPKVIQATMGSFFRVNIIYTNLSEFFSNNKDLTVYGALLEGDNVYKTELKSKGAVLLMGNESKGISKEIIPFVTDKISIPKFGKAESLNVATATAIICSECRRNQ